jgi:ubiquinone/menaquinone biosynthesis C-methylase UbiE
MRTFARAWCPPALWELLRHLRARARARAASGRATEAAGQDLSVYWDPRMAEMLEHWGEGNAWSEIQLIMSGRHGRALDIACGTGRTMELMADMPGLELHGCDISDLLLGKAVARGIDRSRLALADATAMGYADASFDWAYSIGSLEHFTEEGILAFLRECRRVVRGTTFHMVPVSRMGRDEGWIKTFQSYHNNSRGWWEARCRQVYPRVQVLDSAWADEISLGCWLACHPEA